jgi:hypothetical protein
MTDNELDNLIKNKLNNQTFEYEDSYWQQAEKMIDAQRFENKKLVWYKSAFYVAVATVFALLGWFLVENNKITSHQTAINTNTENAQMLELELKSSAIYSQPKATEANKSINSNSINSKENSILVESNDKNNDTKIIRTAKDKLQNIETFLGDELSIKNEAITTENIVINNEVMVDVLQGKNAQKISLNLLAPSFDFTQIDFIKSPINYKNSSKLNSYFIASLEAGTNSFNNTFSSNSFGYYVGGRLYFDIGKLSLNTNLHYENMNQNLVPREIINKTYDFTSNTTKTSIKNQSIDYAIIGLNAMYPVYKNHSIGMGFQYARLIKSNDLFTTQNSENNTIVNKSTNNYSNGINKSDIQFTLNYQFRFAKHLAVNAAYVYGLNYVSTNETANYKNRGVKLGLQYIIK